MASITEGAWILTPVRGYALALTLAGFREDRRQPVSNWLRDSSLRSVKPTAPRSLKVAFTSTQNRARAQRHPEHKKESWPIGKLSESSFGIAYRDCRVRNHASTARATLPGPPAILLGLAAEPEVTHRQTGAVTADLNEPTIEIASARCARIIQGSCGHSWIPLSMIASMSAWTLTGQDGRSP